jgi:hypothetical protein
VAISSCGNFGLVGSASGRIDRYNMQSGAHRGAYTRPGGARLFWGLGRGGARSGWAWRGFKRALLCLAGTGAQQAAVCQVVGLAGGREARVGLGRRGQSLRCVVLRGGRWGDAAPGAIMHCHLPPLLHRIPYRTPQPAPHMTT